MGNPANCPGIFIRVEMNKTFICEKCGDEDTPDKAIGCVHYCTTCGNRMVYKCEYCQNPMPTCSCLHDYSDSREHCGCLDEEVLKLRKALKDINKAIKCEYGHRDMTRKNKALLYCNEIVCEALKI